MTCGLLILAVVANMFSVPLGIMFHADVRVPYSRNPYRKYHTVSDPSAFPTVDRSRVHSQVRFLLTFHPLNQTHKVHILFCVYRSFIAAYIGNIIGALFVALPAVYFYLSDYRYEAASALTDVDVEAGEGLESSGSSKVGVLKNGVTIGARKRED